MHDYPVLFAVYPPFAVVAVIVDVVICSYRVLLWCSAFGLRSQMNEALLNQSYSDKVYGAVSFRDIDTTAGTFDYTVHVSRSGLLRRNGGNCR